MICKQNITLSSFIIEREMVPTFNKSATFVL